MWPGSRENAAGRAGDRLKAARGPHTREGDGPLTGKVEVSIIGASFSAARTQGEHGKGERKWTGMGANGNPRDVCPWRDTELCPRLRPGRGRSEGGLSVRIDVGETYAQVCACQDELPPSNPTDPHEDQTEDRRIAYVRLPPEDVQGIHRWRPAQWEALRALLKDPMRGLSALALGALPDATQALLMDSVGRDLPTVIRVNLDPRGPPGPPLIMVGLRALANMAKAQFEIREVAVVQRSPQLRKRSPSVGGTIELLLPGALNEPEKGNLGSSGDVESL